MGRVKLALAERYAIERVLGQGGTAIVCLAQDLRHSRPVAIKVLRPEIAMMVGAERFLREIETVARLQHPHILPLYDSGEADGLLYFVMPYVSGDSLRDRLERERVLPVDDALAVARDVAAALAFAHQRGVVHRDIKPENIMLFGGAAVVADFGIARVLSAAGEQRATEGGLALGTPLYMSPEQAAADGAVDARSDVYSLGCVLYEMLGGAPPFTGLTSSDVLSHHLVDRPRPITELRSTVPPALALVVAKALAKLPADRFQSAAEFAEALRVPSGPFGSVRRRRAGRLGAVAIVAAAALALLLWRRGPPLDARLYFVPPFAHMDPRAPPLLSAGNCANYLRRSLARWAGLRTVDGIRTADLLGRNGPAPPGGAAAVREARQLGAGRLILGAVWLADTMVYVHASLYDVAHPQAPLVQQEIPMGAHPTPQEMASRFDRLADSLVAGAVGAARPTSRPGVFETHSLEALLDFVTADSALYAWNLARADSGFRAARDADPEYAYAWLRVAQVAQWRGAPPAAYADDAARALARAARLAPADSAHAAALAALGAGRFQDACATFRRLTRRNPEDVLAWYGLGDCLSRDHVVMRDAASPSGWRFRTSYREAIAALSRALRTAPSVSRVFQGPAFQRLAALFYTSSNVIRPGHPEPPDTGLFGAFPDLDHDTLAFLARPLALVREGAAGAVPLHRADAIRHNRDTLLAVTAAWIAAFPSSPEAWAARARALEVGGLLESPDERRSALGAARRASALRPDTALAADLATLRVRLLLKTGRFAAAAAAADSAVASPALRSDASARRAALLALRGRVEDAARALETTVQDTVVLRDALIVVRGDLRRRVGRLEAFAAFEAPPDSVREALLGVQQAAGSYFAGPEREEAVWALLSTPVGMAFGALRPLVARPGPPGPDDVLRWQLLLAAGDTSAVRRERRSQDAVRERLRMLPGDVDPEAVFNEARLALALGDTADAVRRLDGTLSAPSTLHPFVLDRVPPVAALVRAMALRAELAARTRDRPAARQWAGAVLTLWRGADPALRPTLARMQELAGTSN